MLIFAFFILLTFIIDLRVVITMICYAFKLERIVFNEWLIEYREYMNKSLNSVNAYED